MNGQSGRSLRNALTLLIFYYCAGIRLFWEEESEIEVAFFKNNLQQVLTSKLKPETIRSSIIAPHLDQLSLLDHRLKSFGLLGDPSN